MVENITHYAIELGSDEGNTWTMRHDEAYINLWKGHRYLEGWKGATFRWNEGGPRSTSYKYA